ncbi:S1C family serine protease [Biformimicrobium ophioploci]|uniref:Do family serine endopeptidase AlgW n=1 Tax=Biformimicrobium ophioploci TaxID=3036711 RepID=A0ABQ6LX34_9GAMM|nr:trypsin-like peptidase domain-containing protein [Microbulbifer sp. NKW57]GMG86611.1 Do family serine endopeptidase AlgW [Microbulbifer sp. NKW57]
MKRFLAEWAGPALVGLLIAAILLVFFPQLRNANIEPAKGNDWRGPVSYADAVSLAGPAVVNIYTKKVLKRQKHPLLDNPIYRRLLRGRNIPQERIQSTLGSGVVVKEDGYILTNNHVIAGASQITVLLADGREAQAQLVGTDEDFDLAVLKVDMQDLTAIELGTPDAARVGDVVLAIGNPFGVGQSVTQGIISATGRSIAGSPSMEAFSDYIQTDAAINPGNSGGALVDAHGRLLGINTSVHDQSSYGGGIGYAIPADLAIQVMANIIEYGQAEPGWLGVEVQPLTPELARSLKVNTLRGVVVIAVQNQGPAHSAGLQPGDVITSLSGVSSLAAMRPGDEVQIHIIRRGQRATITATAGVRPANE